MTTVVADRKLLKLYADDRIEEDGNIYSARKLYKHLGKKDKFLFAIAGDVNSALKFISVFKKNYDLKLSEFERFDFDELKSEYSVFAVIILSKDGTCLIIDENLQPLKVESRFVSQGSGATCFMTLCKFHEMHKQEIKFSKILKCIHEIDLNTGAKAFEIGFEHDYRESE